MEALSTEQNQTNGPWQSWIGALGYLTWCQNRCGLGATQCMGLLLCDGRMKGREGRREGWKQGVIEGRERGKEGKRIT